MTIKHRVRWLLWRVWYDLFHCQTSMVANHTADGFFSRPARFASWLERGAAHLFGVLGPFHYWLGR